MLGALGLVCDTGLVCYKTGLDFGFLVLLEVFWICVALAFDFVIGWL